VSIVARIYFKEDKPMNNQITEWRRLEIVSKSKEEENKLLKLIDDKKLAKRRVIVNS